MLDSYKEEGTPNAHVMTNQPNQAEADPDPWVYVHNADAEAEAEASARIERVMSVLAEIRDSVHRLETKVDALERFLRDEDEREKNRRIRRGLPVPFMPERRGHAITSMFSHACGAWPGGVPAQPGAAKAYRVDSDAGQTPEDK